MTYSWSQPICEACWINQEVNTEIDENGDTYLVSIRTPLMMKQTPVETCSWCGDATIVGIYKREDPSLVRFPALKNED